ncbi:GDSL esterase/lipase 4-like [Senna tora]|uniref:GDSL esterase/lipase 4-like n=1 Tax=Senna tora TaxID=362788 RepID=A0A834XKR1_9FABA|nr:GDSL esterase/lipase 4-like [Senna tora]
MEAEISEEACCGSVLENGKLTCGDVINKEKVKVCDNPNKYLWFDPIHTTDAANAHFVSQLWENHHYDHPYNLRQLYSANYEPESEPEPIN